MDVLEMAQKLKELENLVPYVEKFCKKYRELFPIQTVVQESLFSQEDLLRDNILGKGMRSEINAKIINVMKKYKRSMRPLEIKIAYEKEHLPNASKEDIKTSRKIIQQKLLYLQNVKNVLGKNSKGEYYLLDEQSANININT